VGLCAPLATSPRLSQPGGGGAQFGSSTRWGTGLRPDDAWVLYRSFGQPHGRAGFRSHGAQGDGSCRPDRLGGQESERRRSYGGSNECGDRGGGGNLAAARVEAIAYAFATGSFYRDPSYATRLVEWLEKAAGDPAVATSPARVEALRFFGARRVSVTSPYLENGATSAFAPTLTGCRAPGAAFRIGSPFPPPQLLTQGLAPGQR
jgi:hypothetical protein